ncbi:hypothetical protein GCM10009530_04630 [Microbispora corallina]|uniref:Uncharacterized protein n=1 Tax=Microbispora corallina TaxID=83302 RepID=A0ABQ4FR81_9ACTN|nr:hypothetical protein Mco01_03100 [Microbispora corallina]
MILRMARSVTVVRAPDVPRSSVIGRFTPRSSSAGMWSYQFCHPARTGPGIVPRGPTSGRTFDTDATRVRRPPAQRPPPRHTSVSAGAPGPGHLDMVRSS